MVPRLCDGVQVVEYRSQQLSGYPSSFVTGPIPTRVSYKAVLSFGSALLLSQIAPRERFARDLISAIVLSGNEAEFERVDLTMKLW